MKARFGCARLPRDIQGQKVWVSAILAGRCNRLSRRFATANPVSRAPVSAISKFCILVSLMLFLAPWLISERSRTPRVVASQCCRQSKPRGVEQIPANNIFRHSSNGPEEKQVFSTSFAIRQMGRRKNKSSVSSLAACPVESVRLLRAFLGRRSIVLQNMRANKEVQRPPIRHQ